MANKKRPTQVSDTTLVKLWSVYKSCDTIGHLLTMYAWVRRLWEQKIIDDRCYSYYRRLIARSIK